MKRKETSGQRRPSASPYLSIFHPHYARTHLILKGFMSHLNVKNSSSGMSVIWWPSELFWKDKKMQFKLFLSGKPLQSFLELSKMQILVFPLSANSLTHFGAKVPLDVLEAVWLSKPIGMMECDFFQLQCRGQLHQTSRYS